MTPAARERAELWAAEYRAGATVEDIAWRHGRRNHRDVVKALDAVGQPRRARKGLPLRTSEWWQQAVALRDQKLPYHEIATQLNRTKSAVCMAVKRMRDRAQ